MQLTRFHLLSAKVIEHFQYEIFSTYIKYVKYVLMVSEHLKYNYKYP
jgi:hypothetical protein